MPCPGPMPLHPMPRAMLGPILLALQEPCAPALSQAKLSIAVLSIAVLAAHLAHASQCTHVELLLCTQG